jgi:ribonuclease-3
LNSLGFIDRTTSEIVSNQNLTKICTHTGIAYYINGNPSLHGEQSPKTMTATVEAIIAAVFLDSGKTIETVRTVMASLGLEAPTTTSNDRC